MGWLFSSFQTTAHKTGLELVAEGRRGGQRVALSAAASVYSFALQHARGRREDGGFLSGARRLTNRAFDALDKMSGRLIGDDRD
jgi:hypothetical protein